MGPLRLIDEIGVDITIDIAATLEKAYGARDHAATVLFWLRDQKMLGRKTGGGFYAYEGKAQKPNEALAKWRAGLHGEPEGKAGPNIPAQSHRDRHLPAEATEIAHRLIFLMINEAARCLEEKVVSSPEDADYGMILGTGFAPFRGGPLRFADHLGAKNIVAEMSRLSQVDEKFTPCDILQRHARAGTTFYEE